jgi:hypothetical protein
MKFEGLWSSKTHPKDFPTALWLTHFSDIIGATHDKNYSFWAEGQWATDGVRQLAEWGSTAILESELRQQVHVSTHWTIFYDKLLCICIVIMEIASRFALEM